MRRPQIFAHFVISADGKILPRRPLSAHGEKTRAELLRRADALLDLPEAGEAIDPAALRRRIELLCDGGKNRTLFCENSPALILALLKLDLLDEIFITIAPLIHGDAAAPTLTGNGPGLAASREFRLVEMFVEDDECHTRHIRRRARSV